MSALAPDLAAEYAHCEAVTRRRAANFYYGIRLLPRERRRAMCAAYAFARRVDDVGDGQLERDEKLVRLQQLTHALEAIERHGEDVGSPREAIGVAPPSELAGDPVMLALADTYARFALPHGALGELIEGVRMDVEGVAYASFDELVVYCRRVAGAIGRVCLAIFASRAGGSVSAGEAQALADDLGVALQLTNILRDLREDAEGGRVYIPAEDLRRFGVLEEAESRSPAQVIAALARNGAGDERLHALVSFEAERARQWFDRGLQLVPLLDRRSAACVLAMAGIYRRLLERIAARPADAVRNRTTLPATEKAWVAARGMLVGSAGAAAMSWAGR